MNLIFVIIPVSVVFYLIGKYTERFKWNQLIKDGKIPRPVNRNINHGDYWANQ